MANGCSCSCGSGSSAAKPRTVLFYACSGGANVAEIADRVARQMMFEGHGSMYCLAGLGAGIPDMVQTARSADLNVLIEGCPMDCGKKIFQNAGLTNVVQVKVTDLGIAKAKGVRPTDAQVQTVAAAVRQALAR